MAANTQHQNFISGVAAAANALLDARAKVKNLREQFIALDLQNNLIQEDLAGSNSYLGTPKTIYDVFSTFEEIEALFISGDQATEHLKNLLRFRP